MLLDINAYVGHWPFKQLKYNTCDSLLDRMNQFGVDVSVISNLNGIFYKNTQPANEELHEEIQSSGKFHDRFVPFAVINPTYPGWKADLKFSVDKLGMKGIRIYPKYHDYEVTDPGCIELVKIARDQGLPVALSFRMVDSRQRSWMDVEKEWDLKDVVPIIQEVPDAKYLFLNLCNSVKLSEEEDLLIRKANILFDTSGRSINALPELLKRFGDEKFAFGTHSPILDYLTGLLRIESLREEEAVEDRKDLIRFSNAKMMLGI
jgi:predicted TIM-barrel fold metal-dependent hydrolase